MKYIILIGLITLITACATTKPEPTIEKSTVNTVNQTVDAENTTKNHNYQLKDNKLYTANGTKINNIFYFKSDSYKLATRYYRDVLAHARFMKTKPELLQIQLTGHADERGSREYNLALGEQRARSLGTIIDKLGASNYEVISYGEERPQDDGNDESAWSRNRRAEIIYLAK